MSAPFADRHIGPSLDDEAKMLAVVGYGSIADLIAGALPPALRDDTPLQLPAAVDEAEATAQLRRLADKNTRAVSMIGLGYADTHTPAVIRRNVLENPSWYTAYTPYQPEISQGRLEALLTFQTVVEDLTGLPTAGASLLDEPTAAAEAMTVARRASKAATNRFYVDADCHPQTIAVVATRAEPLGIDVVVADLSDNTVPGECFGILVQNPGSSGVVRDYTQLVNAAHESGALVTVATDLLALTLIRPPGEIGADIAVGSAQRFGVPLGFGGPHAGFMAVRAGLERQLPGRLVGVSIDADGAPAYRLALQTREQHIRREKATSNICTAQVLLAVIAGMYAVYHGPDGLRDIAVGTHRRAAELAAAAEAGGLELVGRDFFDTVRVRVPGRARTVVDAAAAAGVNVLFVDDDTVGVACDETTTAEHVAKVCTALGVSPGADAASTYDGSLTRESTYLTHAVFHTHRSETSMLRYLRKLAGRDFALDRGMIPLGSCTMKLNATAEMEPISWPEFAGIHPFAPLDQAAGHLAIIRDLERWLAALTGYDAVSLQPNAGSQGEFAGLLAIRAYHRDRNDAGRDVCLIPSSAHGTNAASAAMAGMRVVVVACDDAGNVSLDDLRAKVDAHRDDLAAIMVT